MSRDFALYLGSVQGMTKDQPELWDLEATVANTIYTPVTISNDSNSSDSILTNPGAERSDEYQIWRADRRDKESSKRQRILQDLRQSLPNFVYK